MRGQFLIHGGFFHAMTERDFTVAKGDEKGRIVAMDVHGKIYSIPRKLSIPVKDVRARLGDEQELQSVDEAKHKIANDMLPLMMCFKNELRAQTGYITVQLYIFIFKIKEIRWHHRKIS